MSFNSDVCYQFNTCMCELKMAYLFTIFIKQFNPCPAGPGYIRFQESFNVNKTPLKLIKYSVVDAQLIKYFNLGDVYFS